MYLGYLNTIQNKIQVLLLETRRVYQMSETVHYKGVLKKAERYDNETLEEQCKRLLNGKELPFFYDSYEEFYSDEYYHKAVILNDIIYLVEREDVDPYENIFTISKINDNEFKFEVRYYNGGCSFNEAIENAFENMN